MYVLDQEDDSVGRVIAGYWQGPDWVQIPLYHIKTEVVDMEIQVWSSAPTVRWASQTETQKAYQSGSPTYAVVKKRSQTRDYPLKSMCAIAQMIHTHTETCRHLNHTNIFKIFNVF